MRAQSLNGQWYYRVGKGKERPIEVPFSALAVGRSECRRCFDIENSGDRVFLKFDGITYAAKVFLNSEFVGEMLAYSEYIFDVTDKVKPKDNELVVELEDIDVAFGPTEGWENYGGIIRDVSLMFSAESHIKDVFFYSNLKNNYRDADYKVDVEIGGSERGELQISLVKNGRVIDSYTDAALTRSLSGVSLWSPETPELYELRVELTLDGALIDEYSCKVGFREFKCDRHRFILNGEPVFLWGVCRHEMIGDSGHVISAEQIEKELKKIKDSGCNFVRLVHYPHCKQTLEIADRIGLMVSEEPGLWWSDTSDSAVAKGSLEVLRRTILRDRNHASIVFWLCFNECIFTESFLIDSARVCRECDPTRLVSGANCMSDADTLKYYNICGFDFYTMHPYSPTFERSLESARILHDKPLMFTEWGGYFVYDNPHLITEFIEGIYALYEANSDEGALAGASFWYWSELNDFGRGGPACVDGVLKEALTDKNGEPTMIYRAFCEAWKSVRTKRMPEELYYYEPLDSIDKTALASSCGAADRNALLDIARVAPLEKFSRMRGKKVDVGPILMREEVKGIAKIPYLISDGNTVEFECGEECRYITLLGAVSLPKGYPIASEYGELAAEITVEYSDGEEKVFPMRNGIEFTAAISSIGSSRINPVGERVTRFASFGYDKNFENYIINRLELDLGESKQVRKISLSSLDKGYNILIYGTFI